jgi:hypothetical protein
MAAIECIEAQAHATLTVGLKGRHEWSCPYIITMEYANDDAMECVLHLESIGRGILSNLAYGTTYDNTVVCKQISPTRRPQSAKVWDVVCTYSPPESADGTDEDGKPTDDPFAWRSFISCVMAYFQTPVWKAWNVDALPEGGTGAGYKRPADTLGPVINSAGMVYDPPLMRETPEAVVRISGNYHQYWQSGNITKKVGRINKWPLYWHASMAKYGFGYDKHEPYCVLCSAAGADYRYENNLAFWRYTYEFRIRQRADDTNPQDGFLETILDRGLTRLANAGAPDGAGSTVSGASIKIGMAEAAGIRDWQGGRIGELVMLDGHGQPLQGSDTNTAPPVYFRWRVHPYGDFYYPSIPLKIFRQI